MNKKEICLVSKPKPRTGRENQQRSTATAKRDGVGGRSRHNEQVGVEKEPRLADYYTRTEEKRTDLEPRDLKRPGDLTACWVNKKTYRGERKRA